MNQIYKLHNILYLYNVRQVEQYNEEDGTRVVTSIQSRL